jgi:tripartite-type tricarboxylate transporter receptor subunit TctC
MSSSQLRAGPPRRALMLASSLVLAVAALWAADAQAQAGYPNKPVVFIVPFPAGGGTDIAARLVATKLTTKWGQSVVVENRAGAAGLIGADVVAKARPDGYTLLIANVGTQSINPTLYARLPYNPDTAFAPISQICELPFVLMATPSFPANNARELVALAKAEPGKVTFASSGSGGSPHLTAEIFQVATGTRLTHIPYKGTPPALVDVSSGQVPFMFDQMTAAISLAQAGRLKLLAVTTSRRMALAPQLPTMMESGVPKFEMASWQAVYAPKGTPSPIVQKLNAEIRKILALSDVKDKLVNQLGMEIVGSTPEELAAHMAREIPRWAELVKKSGATPG